MRTAVVQLQLSGNIQGEKAICITAGWDVSSKVPFLSKNYDSSKQFFFFSVMKTNNFQEQFYLKLFSDKSITEYPKEVHLPWLYFYLDKTWEQRLMHVCHGLVKIIYINVEQQSERLYLSKDIEHTESDILGDTSQTGLCLIPSWGFMMNQKKGEIWTAVSHIPWDIEWTSIEISFFYHHQASQTLAQNIRIFTKLNSCNKSIKKRLILFQDLSETWEKDLFCFAF